MTTDEVARLHLYEQARSGWGDDAARTLMTALPWTVEEFATKHDIALLRQELVALEARLEATIESTASSNLRTMILSMIVTNVTLAGLVFGGAELA